MTRNISTSSETLQQLGNHIADNPHIRQALLNGKVLSLYYDTRKEYFRLKEQRKIIENGNNTLDEDRIIDNQEDSQTDP